MAVCLLLNGNTLDIEQAELCDASGRLVQLRRQALSVLVELARRAGEVVTKRDLTIPRRGDMLIPDRASTPIDSPPAPGCRRHVAGVSIGLMAVAALFGWLLNVTGLDALRSKATSDTAETTRAVLPLRELNIATGVAAPDGVDLAYMIAGELAGEKALSWNPLRPSGYAAIEARLRYAMQDYDRGLRSTSECLERTPASVFCMAIWLSVQLRTGRAAEAEAAWPKLMAAAPSLQTYRFAPRDTPEARSIEEDLDRVRGKTRATP